MTVDAIEIKHQLLKKCAEYVDLRIRTAKQSMDDAQMAANEEGKSSAGDKYETGRAMMHIERDKAAQQLEEALKLKSVIDHINPTVVHQKVMLGSLVITNAKKIFIAIGIGKMDVDKVSYLVVAPTAPIGRALMGLTVKAQITFNKEVLTILQII
jgi:transcription elongation GreA/GreB family factor